jgi:hypothetical protein
MTIPVDLHDGNGRLERVSNSASCIPFSDREDYQLRKKTEDSLSSGETTYGLGYGMDLDDL